MSDLRKRSLSEPGPDNGRSHRGRSGKVSTITVDQLGRYRRRRPSGISPDNLQPLPGSFAQLKSEYMRRFRAPSLEALQRATELPPIYRRSQGESSTETSPVRRGRRPDELTIDKVAFIASTEHASRYVAHPLQPRIQVAVANCNLESPGPAQGDSEHRSEFKKYEDPPRREHLSRRSTELKLEGNLRSDTEYKTEFIPLEIPPPHPKSAKLKKPDPEIGYIQDEIGNKLPLMESEYQRSYSPISSRRSSATHVKLDGDFTLTASSKENFEKLQENTEKPKDQEKGLVMTGTMSIYPKDSGKENKDETNINKDSDVKLEGDFQVVQKEQQFKIKPTQPTKLVGKWSELNNDARYFRDDKIRIKSARKLSDKDAVKSRPPTGRPSRLKERFETSRSKMIDDDEGPPFEGPFECQPEYRKARMDMLIKERPPPRKKFEPDMTRLPPLYDPPPQHLPIVTRSRPASRVSSPTTFKLKVVPPSPANKPSHVFTPNALVAPVKEPPIRRTVDFLRRYRSTETETETENEYSEDDGRAFVVLDAPLPGTRRREKLLRKAEICARNNNWMPPWYDRIQR